MNALANSEAASGSLIGSHHLSSRVPANRRPPPVALLPVVIPLALSGLAKGAQRATSLLNRFCIQPFSK
jgi:hypothetical protein